MSLPQVTASVLLLNTLLLASTCLCTVVISNNTAVGVNDTFQVTCTVSSSGSLNSVQLFHNTVLLANGSAESSTLGNRSTVVKNDTSLTVTISSVQLNDSGSFLCQQTCAVNGTTTCNQSSQSSELVVLERPATCLLNGSDLSQNANVFLNDMFNITCIVTYAGNWPPSVQLQVLSVPPVILPATVQSTGNSVRLEYVSTATIAQNTIPFSHVTFFQNNNNLNQSYAQNVPSYNNSVKLSFRVLFAPFNMVIFPEQGQYSSGQTVTCGVVSNPPSSFTWVDANNQSVSNQEQFTLGCSPSYTCIATNIYGSANKSVDTSGACNSASPVTNSSSNFTVTMQPSSGSGQPFYIWMIIAICIVIFIALTK